MSKLKVHREKQNLTQQELADQSGISVRTIQRIEAGNEPQGHTLKRLAKTLDLKEDALLDKEDIKLRTDSTLFKLINLSSLPFTIFPPANIIVPLVIMFANKNYKPLTKQIVSVQILWLICAAIIFMLSAFVKKGLALENGFILLVMILLVLSNVFVILRNAREIDKRGELYFKLDFSLI